MFGIELPKYYSVVINTGYGELPIFFTKSFLNNKMIEEIEEGNTISGDILLSGDVCINEYEKYAEDNRQLKQKITKLLLTNQENYGIL